MLRPNNSLSFSLHGCVMVTNLHTLHWCMHIIIHCKHCDNVATSSPIIAANGVCSVMTCTSCVKSSDETFSNPYRIMNASLYILLFWQR